MVSSLTLPVELSRQPAAARRELARMLDDAAWAGDVDSVILAVHEAMVNAQHHGGGVSRAIAGFDHGDVVVEVSDQGAGFGIPDSSAVPDGSGERGRGLFLIRRLAAEARVIRTGRDVRLRLRFER